MQIFKEFNSTIKLDDDTKKELNKILSRFGITLTLYHKFQEVFDKIPLFLAPYPLHIPPRSHAGLIATPIIQLVKIRRRGLLMSSNFAGFSSFLRRVRRLPLHGHNLLCL
jgi:hypothetical protein